MNDMRRRKSRIRTLIAIAVLSFLSACTSVQRNVADVGCVESNDIASLLERGKDIFTSVSMVDPSALQPGGQKPDAFDEFLNCQIGPSDSSDIEERLLRGHIVVTLLAIYGDYTVRKSPSADQPGYARALLESISSAELKLGEFSPVLLRAAGNKHPLQDSPLKRFERVSRIMAVLQVAIDTNRPTIARFRNDVQTIVGAMSGAPTALKDLVATAVRTIDEAVAFATYGRALKSDAKAYLQAIQQRPKVDRGSRIQAADWEVWDNYLFHACDSLSGIAKTPNRCVPSAATLIELQQKGNPPHRNAS